MMKKIGLAVGMLLLASPAFAGWEYRQTTDEMTDKVEHQAFVFDTDSKAMIIYGCSPGEPLEGFLLGIKTYTFKKGANPIVFRFGDRPARTFNFFSEKYFSHNVAIPSSTFLPFLLAEGGAKTLRIKVDIHTFTFDNGAFGEVFGKMRQACNFKIPGAAK